MIFKKLFGRKTNEEDWDDDEPLQESQPGTTEEQNLLSEMIARARTFNDFNQRKLNTITAKLNNLDQEIFHLLPALLHLNIPFLPGHFEEPAAEHGGITNHKIAQSTLRLLQTHFPSADLTHHKLQGSTRGKHKILSLAAMGSLATIAQTSKSDFDIWVCLNKSDFSSEYLAALAAKLVEIEKWAERTNHFECHFFITDLADARANHFGESDSESAGSALGKILKEEFYRTHTVLAGQPPLWTVMPPDISDEEYQRIKTLISTNYQLDPSKYIDLGNAQRITLEEGFGAALWQLNKALKSPFKSALKMALIEDFMDPTSANTLLCEQLKKNLLEIASQPRQRRDGDSLGEACLLDAHPRRFELDGYLLMFNRILDYYERKGQRNHKDILRKCFYLKVGETITGIYDPQRQKSPRKDMLAQLVENWGWENEEILDLNAYREWPFHKIVTLGKQVNSFIVEAYKRLSQLGATASVKINPTDLTVLGRKLFTFYSRKDDKIDFLPRSFEDSLHQDELTFSFAKSAKGGSAWRVYRGHVSAGELQTPSGDSRLLRQTRNLAGLLMWLVINGIWDKSTQVNLVSRESPVSAAYLQDVLGSLLSFFPPIDVASLPNQNLLNETKVKRLYIILNLNSLPRTPRLEHLDIIYDTSWGEVFYEHSSKLSNLEQGVQFCLEKASHVRGVVRDIFKVHIPAGKTGVENRQLSIDFEQIFFEVAEFFFGEPLAPDIYRCCVVPSDQGVITFEWDGSEIRNSRYVTFEDFFQKRERGSFRLSELKISYSPSKLLPQQAMAKEFRNDVIQVFVHQQGIQSRVYILDEMGGSSYFSLSSEAWSAVGNRLALFLQNVAKRLAAEPYRVQRQLPPPELAIYHVTVRGPNQDKYELEDRTKEYLAPLRFPSEIEKIEEMSLPNGERAIFFHALGKTFSSAEHGAGIFHAVAAYVQEKRGDPRKRAIYVGDLELPSSFRSKNCPKGAKTVHYLHYKKMLESKLNQALQSL